MRDREQKAHEGAEAHHHTEDERGREGDEAGERLRARLSARAGDGDVEGHEWPIGSPALSLERGC